jgi:hypothetical protein
MLYSLVGGLALGGALGFVGGFVGGLATGLAIGGAIGLGLALAAMIDKASRLDPDSGSPQRPATSWRDNWNFVLLVTLAFGLIGGLAGGLGAGITGELASWLAIGLVLGLTLGLTIGLGTSEAWFAFLASAQLAMRWHTPVRLMKFLEDAHGRNVLRTVGPAYQFRHARLQDRLADAAGFPDDAPRVGTEASMTRFES